MQLKTIKNIIVANWKMNGTPASAGVWTKEVVTAIGAISEARVVVCPPYPLLSLLKNLLSGSGISVGGQDCHTQPEGAYTGEVSAALLSAIGCEYVIAGHSERRTYFNETNDIVRCKAERAIKCGLIPIICVGETLQQRDDGKAIDVIKRQIEESIPDEAASGNFILAYEPVWAIGSGKIPTMGEIKQIHDAVIIAASTRTGACAKQISVLYGGSVKSDNAKDIMALDSVSGVLVGGASLKADEFIKIVEFGV